MYNNLFLPYNTYLAEVMKFLPANKIIYKYLTGCGATHLELICDRWSIIIEPYIPVILGKRMMEKEDKNGKKILVKNPNVLAVYEKTNVNQIINYLSTNRKNHKIVSTPEGLIKIVNACLELEIDIYDKFFLLVDECEKLIQDANFRESIIDVMNHFFLFKNRSFISATPLPPSDPRFSQYNFDDFIITPENKIKIKIDLHTTNNIASTLKNYLIRNRNDHYLIFINSTERIASVINFLKIADQSQVFCSKESADILKSNEIDNAQEHWDKSKFKKYNFFTSRFFTAFDLKLDCKPNVLIISDVVNVIHSALDPSTDIIQIAGRSRNGINHLAHITNWDPGLRSISELEVKAYILGLQDGYNMLKQFRDQCNNSQNTGTYFVFNEALESCTFNRFLNKQTMSICHFMIDNEIHSNRIKGYYKREAKIVEAYNVTERFDLNHKPEFYNIEDKQTDRLKKGISQASAMEYVCELFEIHFASEKEKVFNLNPNHVLYDLIKTHQTKYRYYRELGIEKIRELNYSPIKIEKAYVFSKIENSDSYLKLMLTLQSIFRNGTKFTASQITKHLAFYFKRYGVRLRATVTQLDKWFKLSPRTTLGYAKDGREIKGYIVIEPRHSLHIPKKFRQ
ncbi:MAG: hypothetical protein V4546_08985 [Bacteroidota bacterium]